METCRLTVQHSKPDVTIETWDLNYLSYKPWEYPDRSLLRVKSRLLFERREDALRAFREAKRYIEFTEALGLTVYRLVPKNLMELTCAEGMDHSVVFGNRKDALLILDSPYQQNKLNANFVSVWLPRTSDPYYPGFTFARLSTHVSSEYAHLIKHWAKKVSTLNFELEQK